MTTAKCLKELLKDIKLYSFGWHCDCGSCKSIRKRIEKELEEIGK